MAASAALFAIGPASANAVSTDPSSGSPPGTIYKLPVDTGRQDAAPRGDGDGASSGGGGGVPGSTFRSENNFGTSAVVPGASGSAGGGKGAGGSGAGDGGGKAAAGAALSSATETGDTSVAATYLLLAMILAVGGFLGWFASRAGRAAAD